MMCGMMNVLKGNMLFKSIQRIVGTHNHQLPLLVLDAVLAFLLAALVSRFLLHPSGNAQPAYLSLTLLSLAFFPIFFAARSFSGRAKLKWKLVSAFLLISLVPASLLSLLDQRSTYNALSANSRQAMLSAANRTAMTLDSFILANLATVRTESMIPQFADFLALPPDIAANSPEEQAIMSILDSLKRRDQINITSIALLNLQGISVADTYGPDSGSDKSTRLYFLEPLRTGLPYVSPVGMAGLTRQPSLYFSCPVRDTAGNIVGMLRFRYKASVLQQLLLTDAREGDETLAAVLVDEVGIRLADSRRPDLVLTPAFPLRQEASVTLQEQRRMTIPAASGLDMGVDFQALDPAAPSFFRAPLHGPESETTLNVKTRLRSTPWTLVLGYSESANLARIESQSFNALILVLCVAVAVIFGTLFFTRRITEPLMQLTAAADAISRGQEDVLVDLKGNTEIGELAGTFNTMSEALRTSRQKLIASGERLQTLLDTLPDAVLVHGEQGEILDVNRSFQTLFGYSQAEAAQLSIETLSGGGLTTRDVIRHFQHCILHGACEFEWTSRRKDGTNFPSSVRLRKLALQEGPRVMAVIMDDTVKKRSEQTLLHAKEQLEQKVEERTRELREANEQLQQLDALKSAFISMVSHELRTPLTSVLGFAKLTAKAFRKNFLPLVEQNPELAKRGEVVLNNLLVIESEGARLARLVHELLDINKIESGKSEWHDVELHLGEEMHAAVSTMQAEFAEKPSIHFESVIDPQTPPVKADRDRIRQLFLNLLSNALKFTATGFIRISVSPTAGGAGVETRVRDSGRGIPPQDLERIFEKFYQVPAPDQDLAKSKGTGLGLAICRQIVEHYGGTLRAESTLGQGATFIVTLPAAR